MLSVSACRPEARNDRPSPPPPPTIPTTASTNDHAEVFRRAFWRQPTSADHILQAERHIDPADGSWRWFIQLHPSPELLAALRDPEFLGLLPGEAPILSTRHPAWFPPAAALPDFEVLQAPTTALTIFYRAADNLLIATDEGQAFAPPAK